MSRNEKRNAKHFKNVEKLSKRPRNKTKHYGKADNCKNYDEMFDQGTGENDVIIRVNTRNDKSTQNSAQSPNKSIAVFDRVTSWPIEEEVLSMLTNMSATIKYLTEKVNSLSSEIRYLRNDPKLQISGQEVTAEEVPLLRKFESYELPIQDQNRLEHLEDTLRTDKTFYIFFINRLAPIVRNLYQSRRQILWGFLNSLISRELLAQYNWTHQTNSTKYSFQKLKQIQSVLWCAMFKVAPSYSVKEFEDDFKANLAKCATQIRVENRQKIGNEKKEKQEEAEKDEQMGEASGQINDKLIDE